MAQRYRKGWEGGIRKIGCEYKELSWLQTIGKGYGRGGLSPDHHKCMIIDIVGSLCRYYS